MKISADQAVIPRDKLTKYLLVPQPKNDKSQFLARLGFTQDNPDDLEQAIWRIIETNEAIQDRETEYGISYQVSGELAGPDGELAVVTVWFHNSKDQNYRFITLKPDKE